MNEEVWLGQRLARLSFYIRQHNRLGNESSHTDIEASLLFLFKSISRQRDDQQAILAIKVLKDFTRCSYAINFKHLHIH